MLYSIQREASFPCDTMRLTISQLLSPKKSVTASQWNSTCNPLLVNNSRVPQPTLKIVHVWMWQWIVYGVTDVRRPSSTSESFNPFATSNCHSNLSSCCCNASFSPVVMSWTGELGRIAASTYKFLASTLAEKWGQAYNPTIHLLWCRSLFSLLRSPIQVLRGSKSSTEGVIWSVPPIDWAIIEWQLTLQ